VNLPLLLDAAIYTAVLGLFAWLMISRRMAATLALPLAALALAVLALAGQISDIGLAGAAQVLLTDVLSDGVTRLSSAIFAVILGAVLAAQMKITGAAERVVRYAAEYAGEDRFRLGLLLLVVIALLFTTLGGLGAVILVATISLPLMFSLGFEPRVAGVLFLLGLSLGGALNPVNWALYISVLGMTVNQVIPFAVVLAALFFVVCVAYLLVQVSGAAEWRRQLWPLACLLLFAGVIWLAATGLPAVWFAAKVAVASALMVVLCILGLLVLWRTLLVMLTSRRTAGWLRAPGNWLAAASVLVPLLLLLWANLDSNLSGGEPHVGIPILAALALGIAFCALASYTRDGLSGNRMMQALFEGISSAGPAIVLLIGIGLLLKATSLPAVVASFEPVFQRLPVQHSVGFVVVFFILSPLALYRGPLNLYGMGSGVVGIISGIAILTAGQIMAAFFSVGMLQGVCDPTNTHNVWIANFCKVPVNDLTRASLPWVLVIVLCGLVAGALMFGG
jgi:hypothetical protein